jgi:serine/threonine protein kinase
MGRTGSDGAGWHSITKNSNYDEKADVYSIGITAIELAYNCTPFDGWEPLKVIITNCRFSCASKSMNVQP